MALQSIKYLKHDYCCDAMAISVEHQVRESGVMMSRSAMK